MNTETNHDQQAAQTTGAHLRSAREQLGLSQQAVAERLCLKVSTVRDIEDDKEPAELASTFLRGYIRSYARLVHIPEEELLPMMEKQTPLRSAKVAPMQSFSLGKRRKKRDGWLMSFTWLILIVVLGFTVAWWWQNHKAQQEEISNMADQSSVELQTSDDSQSVPLDSSIEPTHAPYVTTETPAPEVDTTAPVAAASEPAPEVTSADSANTAPVQNDAVVSPSQSGTDVVAATPDATASQTATLPTDSAQAVAPEADANAIVMNFSADCWLEVTDASGKKLFSGMQRQGGNLNLTGQAPYKLKIGAPAAVQVQFQGKPVDLSRFIRTNQVARLTLNAEPTAAQ